LRALTRTREDLVEQKVALANQLRAQLDAFWPGAKRIFADVDSPIALAFLERYPSPADRRNLGPKRLPRFLARPRPPPRPHAPRRLPRPPRLQRPQKARRAARPPPLGTRGPRRRRRNRGSP